MPVWFTADLHLGHANIIKYCGRPFQTPEERERAKSDPRGRWRVSPGTVRRHDDALLAAINERVGEADTLWVLGDCCWGRREEAEEYRSRIACRNVHLVWGNHDHRSVAPAFEHTTEQEMITLDGQDIWLCHYPLRSWNRRFHGAWSLYGHVHGRLSAEDVANPSWLTRDVGVDACEYRPWSFEELGEWMRSREEAFQLRKEAMLRGDGAEIV